MLNLFYIEGKFHLIRYEDLSIDPFRTTDSLLKFLDLSPNKLIDRFIEKHTQTHRNSKRFFVKSMSRNVHSNKGSSKEKKLIWHKYGTVTNSKDNVFRWRTKMEDKAISDVQRVCEKPMRMLGYNLMTNINQNKYDNHFPLITKTSKEIWHY